MLVAVDKNPNANAMEEDFAISKSCLDKKKKKKNPVHRFVRNTDYYRLEERTRKSNRQGRDTSVEID